MEQNLNEEKGIKKLLNLSICTRKEIPRRLNVLLQSNEPNIMPTTVSIDYKKIRRIFKQKTKTIHDTFNTKERL